MCPGGFTCLSQAPSQNRRLASASGPLTCLCFCGSLPLPLQGRCGTVAKGPRAITCTEPSLACYVLYCALSGASRPWAQTSTPSSNGTSVSSEQEHHGRSWLHKKSLGTGLRRPSHAALASAVLVLSCTGLRHAFLFTGLCRVSNRPLLSCSNLASAAAYS